MDEPRHSADFLAYHDALTGLPNRRLLDDRLSQAVHFAQRRGRKLAVMLIDLDNFKRVNDALGHSAGDAALREVALRLVASVRKADTAARYGADEFALVLSDLLADADCRLVAERVLQSLAQGLAVGEGTTKLAVSIGISIYPGDAGDGEALLRNAGAAMQLAKHSGHNQYAFYGK